MSWSAAIRNSSGENGGRIFNNSVPCAKRSRCCVQRNGLPLKIGTTSNKPSPYRKLRSNIDTTACSSGTNLPLRKTIMPSFTADARERGEKLWQRNDRQRKQARRTSND